MYIWEISETVYGWYNFSQVLIEKDELLKTYEFVRAKDIAYFLNMKVSKIYNFCHKLTNHRGNLKYVNISQKIKCAIVYV